MWPIGHSSLPTKEAITATFRPISGLQPLDFHSKVVQDTVLSSTTAPKYLGFIFPHYNIQVQEFTEESNNQFLGGELTDL